MLALKAQSKEEYVARLIVPGPAISLLAYL